MLYSSEFMLLHCIAKATVIYSSIPLVKVDKFPSGAEYRAMIEQRYGSVQASEVSLSSYQYVCFTIIITINIASCYRHADSRHSSIIDPQAVYTLIIIIV